MKMNKNNIDHKAIFSLGLIKEKELKYQYEKNRKITEIPYIVKQEIMS